MSRPAPGVLGLGVEELRALAVRSRDVVVLGAVVGTVTGLAVALLDRLVVEVMLEHVRETPLVLRAVVPGVGLALTVVALRRLGRGATASTADEYVRAVHHPEQPLDLRPAPGKLAGAVATLGLGGAAGFEGPSIYLGTAVASAAFERVKHRLRGVDRRAVLVAGAAAGVAAIFKAPATGAVFALEVPFQDDLAPRSLLPALVGGASGFTAFALVNGADPLLPVSGHSELVLVDLAAAAAIGLACGVGARLFAAVMTWAKGLSGRVPPAAALAGGAVVLGVLAAVTPMWFDDRSLSMGPGYESVRFALDPSRGLWVIALLATVRVVATASTVGGGGVAGMFVPLVVQGALTGRLLAGLFHVEDQSLWVVVGVAAFLGAGYRVPLASVMFVAEATGRPAFVVPGLLAATIAQLVMGSASVSRGQRRRRDGYLEQRADLPIEEVLSTDTATAHGHEVLAEFFTEHVALARRRAVPLVDDDGRYEGLVVLDDVLQVAPDDWGGVRLADVARTDVPVGAPGWSLGRALATMLDAEVDHLPVVDATGHLRGMVTSDAIVDRAELAQRLGEDR